MNATNEETGLAATLMVVDGKFRVRFWDLDCGETLRHTTYPTREMAESAINEFLK